MQFPSPGQTNHKVHINSLPLPCWNLNRLSETPKHKVFGLNLLAIQTFLHEFRDISLHAFPPVVLFKVMVHLGGT